MTSTVSVEDTLRQFLSGVIEQERIDLIVCAERKATAVLRALMEPAGPDESRERLSWDWGRTVSAASVGQFHWSRVAGERILLFAALVHHGLKLTSYRHRLQTLLPPGKKLVTAGYAVWEGCGDRPDHSYYGAVDTDTYESIREGIIEMLQRHGSLLLATEHIELSVRLQCGLREFYDALSRATENGKAYSFVSGAGKSNITLDEPYIVRPDRLDQLLPCGSNTKKSVCKVRVLERTHEYFSVVPIFYPNTRCVPTTEWLRSLPSFVDTRHLCGLEAGETLYGAIFYLVGLLGSAELLRAVGAVLKELSQENKIILEVPLDDFLHLKAMFPNLDISGFLAFLEDILEDSGRQRPARSRPFSKAEHVSEGKLLAITRRVLEELVTAREETGEGKTWGQMMRVAEEANEGGKIDQRALSVVVDRLIDNGLLVTNMRVVFSSEEEPFVVRTFAPESEVIAGRVRQQMMVRRGECLSTT